MDGLTVQPDKNPKGPFPWRKIFVATGVCWALILVLKVPTWILHYQTSQAMKDLVLTTKQDGEGNYSPTVVAKNRPDDRFPQRNHEFKLMAGGQEFKGGITIPKGWEIDRPPAKEDVLQISHQGSDDLLEYCSLRPTPMTEFEAKAVESYDAAQYFKVILKASPLKMTLISTADQPLDSNPMDP